MPAKPIFAQLTGQPREFLDAYLTISAAMPANVAAELKNPNPVISYFAIRRADREKIIGPEQIRILIRSGEAMHRAAAASAGQHLLGPKSIDALAPLLRDPHPAVIEAALDSLSESVARSETGKALMEALSKLTPQLRHKAMRLLGKFRYRPAVGLLEDIFHRRDNVDSPVACGVLAAIQGRAFTEGITEYLYPDNPIELHIAILECMAENPAPVYYAKATQLLKTLRNKHSIAEVVRRIALWSSQGVDLAISILGGADVQLAEAAQEGLVRHLSTAESLPPGFLQKLAKPPIEQQALSPSASALVPLPPRLDALESGLAELFTAKPDADFQQLLYMTLSAEKHFLRPKLVQLAAARWGDEASKQIEQALFLSKDESILLRTRIQSRWAAQAELQSSVMMQARLVESVGQADLKAPVKEVARHLDSAHLPILMATVSALSKIGGTAEVFEIERKIPTAHWMLKRKIANALAALTKENPCGGLFKLCEDPEPLVRIAAVRALEGIRHEKAYNVLISSLQDGDERVRSAACACLRGFPERKEVHARLFKMLEDMDARVRANTVESLETVLAGDPGELRFRLKPLLVDPNARVVINTSKALFPIEPDLAMPVLDAYLRAPDKNLRAGASWALGQLRRPDAFLCLHFHSLREKDPYVRSFIDKGVALMQDSLFYRDARYLLISTQSGG